MIHLETRGECGVETGDLCDLVASAWDLDGLEEQYRSFLAGCDEVLATGRPRSSCPGC